MDYNYGGGYTGGEPEYGMRGASPAPSGGEETRREQVSAVPEDARPYVGGARADTPAAERAPFAAGEPAPERPSADGQQPRTWSEADYRALPERETNVYTPGIPDPARYSQYRHTPQTDGQPDPAARARRRGGFGRFLRAACLVVLCAAVSAASAYGVVEYRYRQGSIQPANTVVLGNPPAKTSPTPAEGGTQALTSPTGGVTPQTIYEMARKQVVSVIAEATGYSSGDFWGSTGVASSGSGFIISNDGYILTNHHVIEAALTRGFTLKVYTEDGSGYEAQVVGYEQENDVAVLKIEAEGLDAVTTGDSDATKVGERIYTVGDPLGHLEYTMTDGIVSALDRVVAVDTNTSISMFQISAAVNSGNSGGPVYNSNGEVIGIVSAKYKDIGVEGLGFAIPINDAVNIAEQLITTGYVADKTYLGVSVQTVNASAAAFYNMAEGAYVVSVEAGSCAETAGVKIGDIITRLGDISVTSADTLKLAKRRYSPGDTVELIVYRSGESLTLQITLDKDEGASAQETPQRVEPYSVFPTPYPPA
jgi:serine protease Do